MTVKDGKVRKTFTLSEDALRILGGVADEDRSQFVSDALRYFSGHGSGGKVGNGLVSEDVSDPVGFELVRMESVLAKLDSLDFSSYAPWVAFFNDPEVKEYSFLEDSFAGFVSEAVSHNRLLGDLVKSYPADFPLRSFILAQVSDRVSGLVDESSSADFRRILRLKDFLSGVVREGVSSRVKDLLCVKEYGMTRDAYEVHLREVEKKEAERIEQERLEAERLANEKKEAERIEQERLEAEDFRERVKRRAYSYGCMSSGLGPGGVFVPHSLDSPLYAFTSDGGVSFYYFCEKHIPSFLARHPECHEFDIS